ncbi:hypothetical protein RFI_02109, partial [Reticulomyxa filosa]
KCHTLCADLEKIFEDVEKNLEIFGFKKGYDGNWYCQYNHIQLLHQWKCYQAWINQQPRYVFILLYKTKYGIPRRVCMLSNGKWKDYESAFDYEHRTIMLFDQKKLKIKSLQLGNPNKSSLEFNVSIQYYNDIDIHQTHTKWACFILNHTWHFRTIDWQDGDGLANFVSLLNCYTYISNTQEFNSFHVIWKDRSNYTHKEPLNPYSITFKQGIQHIKHNLQIRSHFISGKDELILFECKFDKWKPAISSKMNNSDVLLHDIYKHLPHYPIIQVHWEIFAIFMVSYKCTTDTKRSNLPKNKDLGIELILSNQKIKFNPLLYECDLHKMKIIKDTVDVKLTRNNELQKLFHEIIRNGYLCDLITSQYTNKIKKQLYNKFKKQINYNENNPNELILNDKILTILNELKILFHDDIHKHMGYPLQLWHICAILLYCSKSCNVQFSYDQIQFRHQKWPYLDSYLREAIDILHFHERREESEMEFYCGLKNVRLENIKEIKEGFFISHVSTSDDIQIAQMYRSDQGCILHFHSSMRRSPRISSCDVSWISIFKHEREILFARPTIASALDEKIHKEQYAWNAKIESEDEYTQTILLTWVLYDQYIQQIMAISAMWRWSHSIDLNLIYVALAYNCEGDINQTFELLFEFEQWKFQDKNKQKYKKKINKFVKKRCCNHNINLFCMYLSEKYKGRTAVGHAKTCTVYNGLPFVKKDQKKLIK